jgi:hypothetical protein
MGLTFMVGNPSEVFTKAFAKRVRATLLRHFGESVDLDSEEEPYRTDELGWSGWEQLQRRAARAVGKRQVPHFLSMEAWCGCFVPVQTEPTVFEFGAAADPLQVASLPRLVEELKAVGTRLGLPTDARGLRVLAGRYQDDEDVEADMDVQTYAQLFLAAKVARKRKQVLWVVK